MSARRLLKGHIETGNLPEDGLDAPLTRLPQYRGGQKFFQKPGGQFSLANPTVLGRHNGQISL
jgi:hypothetical protein